LRDGQPTIGAVGRSDAHDERGTGQGEGQVGRRSVDPADHRQLDRGEVAGVAEQGVRQAERRPVKRPAFRHAEPAMAGPTAVLHGVGQSRLDDDQAHQISFGSEAAGRLHRRQ
jgi:hypothetical protein